MCACVVGRGFGGGGGGGPCESGWRNMIIDLVRCRIRQDFQISVKFFRATITCARKYSAPPKQKKNNHRPLTAMFVHLIKLMRVYSACLFVLCFMDDAYIYSKKSCLNVTIKNLYRKARSYSVKYETGEAV